MKQKTYLKYYEWIKEPYSDSGHLLVEYLIKCGWTYEEHLNYIEKNIPFYLIDEVFLKRIKKYVEEIITNTDNQIVLAQCNLILKELEDE